MRPRGGKILLPGKHARVAQTDFVGLGITTQEIFIVLERILFVALPQHLRLQQRTDFPARLEFIRAFDLGQRKLVLLSTQRRLGNGEMRLGDIGERFGKLLRHIQRCTFVALPRQQAI